MTDVLTKTLFNTVKQIRDSEVNPIAKRLAQLMQICKIEEVKTCAARALITLWPRLESQLKAS